MTRPNILVMCTDQQRYDTLGCTGNPHAQTPNLDALAAAGAVFEACYVQNTICSPSRASLFTGQYVHNHGLWANGVALPPHARMFTRALADAGYDCGTIGKQHLSACQGGENEPRHDDGLRVFEWAHDPIHPAPGNAYAAWLRDRFPVVHDQVFGGVAAGPEAGNQARGATAANVVPPEAHFSHWVAERAVAFINDPVRPTGQPFFLLANFFDPHHPFGAPAAYRGRFDAISIPGPVGSVMELATKPAVQAEYSRASYGGAAPGFQDYSGQEVMELRAAYHAMVALVDTAVGCILGALQEAGLAQNTLVVFTSDHGEMLGDHGILLKGPMMYDCCTRVPLVMRWPGRVRAGLRCPELVQWIDLTSTIMDAALIDPAGLPRAQGTSLLDLAAGYDVAWRPWALSEYRDSGHPGGGTEPAQPNPRGVHTTMLRWENWKLVVWHGRPAVDRDRDGELYDLAEDPDELVNLFRSSEHRERRALMMARLLDVLEATEDRSEPRVAAW